MDMRRVPAAGVPARAAPRSVRLRDAVGAQARDAAGQARRQVGEAESTGASEPPRGEQSRGAGSARSGVVFVPAISPPCLRATCLSMAQGPT